VRKRGKRAILRTSSLGRSTVHKEGERRKKEERKKERGEGGGEEEGKGFREPWVTSLSIDELKGIVGVLWASASSNRRARRVLRE